MRTGGEETVGLELDEAYRRLVDAWRGLDPYDQLARLDDFKVAYAYNSGKIENDAVTYHDTREIFENGKVVSFTGELRTLFEIQNQKVAWDWMVGRWASGPALAAADVLEAHRLLTRGTYSDRMWEAGERPGTFKKADYRVGVNEVGKPPELVGSAVAELIDELVGYWGRAFDGEHAMRVAAYLHARLVSIHPFADGNGRTSRLLANLTLLWFGCPPVSVREQDRIPYYGALDAFHEEGELAPLVDFLKAESVESWVSLKR